MDLNPVHLDEAFAAQTVFKRRIVHGMYIASFISAVLANQLPGPGTIYLEQTLSFKHPVYIGDEITAQVTVEEFPRSDRVRLSTVCTKADGTVVITGSALIKRV